MRPPHGPGHLPRPRSAPIAVAPLPLYSNPAACNISRQTIRAALSTPASASSG